jgi:DNA repair photolyase
MAWLFRGCATLVLCLSMREIQVKSILNKKKKRDNWFLDDYTANPYVGCSFNCQYCYIRGSKYGENMEETLAVKINGAEVLDRQLAFRRKKDQYGIIALASATDPYINAEAKYRMTESFLKVILKYKFPVLMITKSEMILRDLDLLREIDTSAMHAPDLKEKLHRGVIISFSFSTLDPGIAATLEPGAPLPQVRLETMKKCKDAGFLVGMNCIPTLPFISDTDEQLEQLVKAGKENGADYILIGGLTLFGDQPVDSKILYHKFLERKFPELTSRYHHLYKSYFAPPASYLKNLEETAKIICKKYQMPRSIIGQW